MNAASRKSDRPSLARMLRAAGIAAAVALAMPLHAQECSGGSAGGTDATGNQCNDPVAALAAPATASTPEAGAVSKPVPTTAPAGSAPTTKATAHRKKVFDERRARFQDAGHPRVAAAPAPATVTPRPAP
jgi:hypothetical protein